MEFIKRVWAFLDGKKSFIGGAILFVAGGLLALKVIDQKTFEIIASIAGAVSVYGLRHAISKMEE